jgi:hypothetical protein
MDLPDELHQGKSDNEHDEINSYLQLGRDGIGYWLHKEPPRSCEIYLIVAAPITNQLHITPGILQKILQNTCI